MPQQAQKGLDSSVGSWQNKFSNSFQVFFAGSYSFLGDMMGQIVNLYLEELTLGQLEFQIVLSKALNHNVQVM